MLGSFEVSNLFIYLFINVEIPGGWIAESSVTATSEFQCAKRLISNFSNYGQFAKQQSTMYPLLNPPKITKVSERSSY